MNEKHQDYEAVTRTESSSLGKKMIIGAAAFSLIFSMEQALAAEGESDGSDGTVSSSSPAEAEPSTPEPTTEVTPPVIETPSTPEVSPTVSPTPKPPEIVKKRNAIKCEAVDIIMHRGKHSGGVTENTVESFEMAAEFANKRAEKLKNVRNAGKVVVEGDIQFSKDGVAYLFHDRRLNSKTNGTGAISKHSSKYVNGLRTNDGQRVATLERAVKAVAKTSNSAHLELELKGPTKRNSVSRGRIKRVIRILNKYNQLDNATLSSTNKDNLRSVRSFKGARRKGLETSLVSRIRVHPSSVAGVADGLVIRKEKIRRADVRKTHKLGKEISGWTTNDIKWGNRLLSLGVDGIITDRPGQFYASCITKAKGLGKKF